jgi:hypothetical protein
MSVSFAGHPGADVRRAIAQHDPVALTSAQEANGILVGADQILEVQDESPTWPFFVERCRELREVVGLKSPTHREDRIAVVCVLNLQHRPSRATTQAACRLNTLKLLELEVAG